ncbi:MAG TPA: hypothetical protein VK166_02375 [Chitinophagaceae bacterium]|nr:hypothetical protein [Chitinophagaceae bacterium]
MKKSLCLVSLLLITLLPGCKKDEAPRLTTANNLPPAFKVELPNLTFEIPTAEMLYHKENDSMYLFFSSSLLDICGCLPKTMNIHFEKKGTNLEGTYEFKRLWMYTEPEITKTSPPKFSLTIISGTATIDSILVKKSGPIYVKGIMQLNTWKDNDTSVVVPVKVNFNLGAFGP